MNRYPLWKYIVIAVALAIGLLYTVPNFFPEVPAVQVSSSKTGVRVDAALLATTEDALRNAGIAYDTWLVQTLPSGETTTHHVRASGQQGEAVTMMFPLVPLDGLAASGPPLDLKVHGAIRGRLRTDGSIEVSVDASRYVMTRDASLATGAGGRSHLRMGLGETVEFTPVPMKGNVQGHELAELMAPAPTAIRIRASRLW